MAVAALAIGVIILIRSGYLTGWLSLVPVPWILALSAFAVALIVFVRLGYRNAWTGFGEKTLWDWLQLLISISIPTVIAVGGFLFTADQNKNRAEIEAQRHDNDEAIEEARSRNEALQSYFNEMSKLTEDESTRTSEENAKGHSLERARTLAILQSLDPVGKRRVLTFLYESGLIGGVSLAAVEDKEKTSPTKFGDAEGKKTTLSASEPVIGLQGADLSGANLSYTRLRGAGLSYANLQKADLSNINLGGADLSNADLRGANLKGANLKDADLEKTCMRGADLSEAQGLTQTQLAEAYGDDNTTLPDSSDASLAAGVGTMNRLTERPKSFNGSADPKAYSASTPVDLDERGIGQMGDRGCLPLPSTPPNSTAAQSSGGGEQEDNGADETKTASNDKEGGADDSKVAVGETAELDDRTITVLEVERNYDPSGEFEPEPGNEFLRMRITLTNTSNQPFEYDLGSFEVMRPTNNGMFERASTAPIDLNEKEGDIYLRQSDLAPGSKVEGNIIFEVPQNDNNLVLRHVGGVGMRAKAITVGPLE